VGERVGFPVGAGEGLSEGDVLGPGVGNSEGCGVGI
jgi:hypothetical protein